ncbi:hypothetical protein [Okibacterium endophyticum]
MSTRSTPEGPPARVWVAAVAYTVAILSLGVWVSAATGQWFALVLAVGLSAPIDVLLVRRHQRRIASR